MYYVYVLKSQKDLNLYIGSTNNLKERLVKHNTGKVLSTKNRVPFDLLYYEAYISEELARKREQSIKKSGSVYTSLVKRLQQKKGD